MRKVVAQQTQEQDNQLLASIMTFGHRVVAVWEADNKFHIASKRGYTTVGAGDVQESGLPAQIEGFTVVARLEQGIARQFVMTAEVPRGIAPEVMKTLLPLQTAIRES